MKDMAAKLLLIAVIILGIGHFIYTNQWANIQTLDDTATNQLTQAQLPTP